MHNEKGVLRTVMDNEVAFFHTYWYFLKSYIPTQRDAQFICCDVSLPSAPASAFMPCEPCSHRSYQHIPCCFSVGATTSKPALLDLRHGACIEATVRLFGLFRLEVHGSFPLLDLEGHTCVRQQLRKVS